MNPHRLTRSVRLRVRPGADPSTRVRLPGPVSLDLAVRRDWLGEHTLARLGAGGARLRLSDADLRFPCPPDPPSTLSAFGVRWAIDHRAIPVNLSINAWIVIEAVEEPDGPVTWVRGRLETGTLRVSGLEQSGGALEAIDRDGCPLDDPFAQVWPAVLGPVTGLIVGHAALQLDVLDDTGPTTFRRRVEPVGVSDDGAYRLWRMTVCGADHAAPPLERPAERIARKLAALVAATTGGLTAVQVLSDPEGADVDLAYAVRIDQRTGLALSDELREGGSRELIRPGVILSVSGAPGQATHWRPESLSLSDKAEFTDRDEFTHVARSRGIRAATLEPAVALTWSHDQGNLAGAPLLSRLPALGFAGPDDPTVPGTGSAVWHVADLDVTGAFSGGVNSVTVQAAWVRLRMDPDVRAGGAVGEDVPRLPGWSDALALEGYAESGAGGWRLSVDVPDAFAPEGRALTPPRVIVRFTMAGAAVSKVELELLDARVTAVTPQVEVCAAVTPLADPEAVPHWPPRAPGDVRRMAGLVFRDSRAGVPALRALPANGGSRLALDCPAGFALAFVPGHRAFVDPSSPGLANVPRGERDQSHGLVPVALRASMTTLGLRVPVNGGRAAWGGPAEPLDAAAPVADGPDALPLALLPWATAVPRPLGTPPPDDEPIAVHHRNLALEPAEFSAAAGDRIPPGRNEPPLPLPRPFVVRAVRDRYTLATPNARAPGGGPLENWLTGVALERAGAPADLRLLVPSESGFPFDRLEVILRSGGTDTGQALSLATRCRFLAFGVSWQAGTGVQPVPAPTLPPPTPPTVSLSDPDGAAGARNGSVPLLFEAGLATPRASLDNLGVVRPRAASLSGGWRVAERLVGTKLYIAVSYGLPAGPPLVRRGSAAGGDLTELDFACDGLLFERDPGGGPDDYRPSDVGAPLSLGSWWAFSTVEGPFAGIDRWPCLCGAPYYALEVKQITVRSEAVGGATRYTPTSLVLSGVLPNPSELTDEAFSGPPAPGAPTVVREASARGQFVDLSVALDGSGRLAAQASSRFDWEFTVARQNGLRSVIPGRLARLSGAVVYDTVANVLSVRPELMPRAVSAFGREWPTSGDPPPLSARATFDGAGRRTGLVFAATDPDSLSVPIAERPVFELPVDLATAVSGEFRLLARVSSSEGLLLSVQFQDADGHDTGSPVVATPSLEQGLYSAFLLGAGPEPGEAGVTTGTGVLALWAEGELADPRLGALLVRESHEPDRRATIGTVAASGPCVALEVLASAAGPIDATTGASSALFWRRAEFVTWLLRPAGSSPAFELLLVDQYFSDDVNPATDDEGPPPAAWLRLRNPPAHGPLRLRATRPAGDAMRLDPQVSWYLATPTTLPATDEPPDTEVLAIPGGPQIRAFAPGGTGSPEPERVRLTFDGSAFGLERLDPEEVPLDGCLDGDATRAALAPGRRTPRLALGGEGADALRLALPSSDLPFAPSPALPQGGALAAPPGGASAVWSLAPLVQVGDRLLARRPRALPLATTRPGPPRVENALVAHRPSRAGTSGAANDPPDADTPPTGFPDPTAPLIGLFSGTGADPDAPLLTEPRLRTLLERTGSAGLALRRVLREGGGPARFQIVRSPFYDRQEVETADRPPLAIAPQESPAAEASLVLSLAPSTTAVTPAAEDDPRRRPPVEAARLVLTGSLTYDADPLPPQPSDGDPCDASRAARLVRQGAQPADADGRPRRLFLREATAFATAAPLPFVPEEPLSDTVATFLPGAVEFRWAADKPGGMIHHAVQPRTKLDADATALGGLSDWAQRDPERFKPPAGAAVTINRGTFTPAADFAGLLRAEVGWDDVLGTLLLDDTAATPEPVRLADALRIRPATGGGYLLETIPRGAVPLRLITVIDQEVVEMGGDDAAFPATAGRPAKIYLVAAFASLTAPLTAVDGTVFAPFVRLVLQQPAPPPGPPPPVPPATIPQVKIVALADLFEPPVATEGLTLWTFRPGALSDDECARVDTFALVWLKGATVLDPEIPLLADGNTKQVKRLAPSPMAPQVAVIVSAGEGGAAPFQKTLTFGPSASPDRGAPAIFRDGSRRLFRFAVQDEAVALTPSPQALGTRRELTLVKYLADGQTLFDVFIL